MKLGTTECKQEPENLYGCQHYLVESWRAFGWHPANRDKRDGATRYVTRFESRSC